MTSETMLEINDVNAFTMGLFMAAGDVTESGVFSIAKSDTKLLQRAQAGVPFETYVESYYRAIHGLSFRLAVKPRSVGDDTAIVVCDWIRKMRLMFYNNAGEKRVPLECFRQGDVGAARNFLVGFHKGCDEGPKREGIGCIEFDQRGKEAMTGIWALGRLVGYEVTYKASGQLDTFYTTFCMPFELHEGDNDEVYDYILGGCRRPYWPSKSPTMVTSIGPSPLINNRSPMPYVYDLETENHHFHVGPGSLVVHNTDSVFVHARGCPSVHEAWPWAVKIVARVTAVIRERMAASGACPAEHNKMKLEAEKIFSMLSIQGKKRYIGNKWTADGPGGTLVAKSDNPDKHGVETERGDACELVKRVATLGVEILFDETKTTSSSAASLEQRFKAIQTMFQRDAATPLLNGTINPRLLINTKKMSRSIGAYAAGAGGARLPVHVQIAQRMLTRYGPDDARTPKPGDRVSYVLTLGDGTRHQASSERGEDPVYAFENRLPIDSHHYLETLLIPALVRILTPAWERWVHEKKTAAALARSARNPGTATATKRLGGGDSFAALLKRRRITGGGDMPPTAVAVAVAVVDAPPPPPTSDDNALFPPLINDDELAVDIASFLMSDVARRVSTAAASSSSSLSLSSSMSLSSSVVSLSSSTSLVASGRRDLLSSCTLRATPLCVSCSRPAPPSSSSSTTTPTSIAQDGFYACSDCVANSLELRRHFATTMDAYYKAQAERADLFQTCQTCMGTASAPAIITCTNASCDTFWDRKTNERALENHSKRLAIFDGTAEAPKRVRRDGTKWLQPMTTDDD